MKRRSLGISIVLAACSGNGDAASSTSSTSSGVESSSATTNTGSTEGSSTSSGEASTAADTSSTSTTGESSTTSDPPPDLGEPFVDGERLVAQWIEHEGARAFVRWFDVELDQPCVFLPDATGVLRCLPGSELALWTPSVGEPKLLFADAACTQPLVALPACELVERFRVAQLRSMACGPTPYTVFDRGAEVLPPDEVYAIEIGGCVPSINYSGVPLFELHAVDDETFVAGEARHVAVDDALGLEIVDGEDGSSQWYANLDVARAHACDRGADESTAQRCYSRFQATRDDAFLHHPQCATTPVAPMRGGPECDPPDFVWVDDVPQVVGSEYAPSDVRHRPDPDTCAMIPEDLPLRFFLGNILAPVELPELATDLAGDGRLRLRSGAAADGTALVHDALWDDTQLELQCIAIEVVGEAPVCMPVRAGDHRLIYTEDLFADAQCTVPAGRIRDLTPAQAAALEAVGYLRTDDATCGLAFDHGREVIGLHDGPLYAMLGGNCVGWVDAIPDEAFVLLGDEVGADAFPRFESSRG